MTSIGRPSLTPPEAPDCPECGEWEGGVVRRWEMDDADGQPWEVTEYRCPGCGCEWGADAPA